MDGPNRHHLMLIEAHDMLEEKGFQEVAEDCYEYTFPDLERKIYILLDDGNFDVYFESQKDGIKHTPEQLIKGLEVFRGSKNQTMLDPPERD